MPGPEKDNPGSGGFQAKAGERFILTLGGALFVVFLILYLLTDFHRLNGWQETTVWQENQATLNQGYDLVQTLGCVNCHIVADSGDSYNAPELDGEGSRRSRAWLEAFFRDPRSVDPSTKHDGVYATNFNNLTAGEKRILVNFLFGLRALPGSANYPKPPPS